MANARMFIRARVEQLIPQIMETSDHNPAGLRAAGLKACAYLYEAVDMIDKAEARFAAKDVELRALVSELLEGEWEGMGSEKAGELRGRIRALLGEGGE